MKVIALAGKQGSGKNTFIDIYRKKYPEWQHFSTSDFLVTELTKRKGKEHSFEGVIKADKQKYRTELQELGDELLSKYKGGAVQALLESIPDLDFCILDSVRRFCEVEYLKKNHDVVFVLIEAATELRNERIGGLTGTDHVTETEAFDILKNDNMCVTVYNNGDLNSLQRIVFGMDLYMLVN